MLTMSTCEDLLAPSSDRSTVALHEEVGHEQRTLGPEVEPGCRDGWVLSAPHPGGLERGVHPAGADGGAEARRRADRRPRAAQRAQARGRQARVSRHQRGDGLGLPRVEHCVRIVLRDRSRRGDRVGGGRRAEAVGPVHLRHPDPSRRRAAAVSLPPRTQAGRSQLESGPRQGPRHDGGYLPRQLHQGDLSRQRHDGRRDQRDSIGHRRGQYPAA